MKYEIQLAKTTDIPRIAALADKIWHMTYDHLIGCDQVNYMLKKYQSEEAIEHAIAYEQYTYFIAVAEKQILGFCGLQPQKDRLFVSKIYVDSSFHGQGLARAFFEKACSFAKKCKKSTLYLTVNKENTNAIAVYQHLGFQISNSVATDIGQGYIMDDYIMEYTMEE